MEPSQFQGGKIEDAHKVLVTFWELLKIMGLTETHGVQYVTLQLHEPARQWWKIYLVSFLVGTPLMSWETFSGAFYN